MISFDVSREDFDHICEIADRVEASGNPWNLDRMTLVMDLSATSANGCPMDFAKLAKADAETFAHDVYGIVRHIDRATGKLGDCFLPRTAKPD